MEFAFTRSNFLSDQKQKFRFPTVHLLVTKIHLLVQSVVIIGCIVRSFSASVKYPKTMHADMQLDQINTYGSTEIIKDQTTTQDYRRTTNFMAISRNDDSQQSTNFCLDLSASNSSPTLLAKLLMADYDVTATSNNSKMSAPTESTNRKHRRKKRYIGLDRWEDHNLTYNILNFGHQRRMTIAQIEDSIEKAINLWSIHIPLNFRRVYGRNALADINIGFYEGNHGDNAPFLGPGIYLAHAYGPPNGSIHFDDSEEFTYQEKEGKNLFLVAAHEFGHVLGLGHSEDRGDLMFPAFQDFVLGYPLSQNDIDAIQKLYGRPSYSHQPLFSDFPTPEPSQFTTMYPNFYPLDICRNVEVTFDAVFKGRHDAIVFFKNSFFWKIKENAVISEPKKIHKHWKKAPKDGVDAAVYSKATRRTYFFKGDRIWVYNKARKLEKGFPKSATNLGLPSNVDLVMSWGCEGLMYIFKGDRFYKVYEDTRPQTNKYHYTFVGPDGKRKNLQKRLTAKPISQFGNGIPQNLDAGVQWKHGETYFFKEDKIYRFSEETRKLIDHPRSIKHFLLKCDQKIKQGKVKRQKNG